ncbi:MAG: hypothetical protein AAGF95_30540, partial [Chloroflexota bacterium]
IGHSTRALAQVMRLGLAVFRASTVAKPATPSVLVVLNENDAAIDGSITELLVKLWQNKGVRHLETHIFPADLNLEHDLIDPNQKLQRIDTAAYRSGVSCPPRSDYTVNSQTG